MHKPKSILMINRKNFEWFNVEFVPLMREKFKTHFTILTNNRENEFIKKVKIQEGDNCLVLQELEEEVKNQSNDEDLIYKQARMYEDKYNITYMRDSFMQDRNIALKYLDSFKNNPGAAGEIPELVNITKEQNFYFEYFEKYFKEKKVDLVISRPDSMIGFTLITIAKAQGIPETFQLPIRVEGYLFWPYGAYNEEIQYKAYLEKAKLEKAPGNTEVKSFYADTNALAIIKNNLLLKTLIKEIIYILKDRLNWLYKDFKRGKLGKRVSMLGKIKSKIIIHLDNRYFNKYFENDLIKIKSKPFIYFPLPMEPEYNTHSLSKEFINIHAMIQQAAISLPSGFNLVVKEHKPNIGLKPRAFYSGLAKLPNIIFAHYDIPGPNLVKDSRSIITISGTTALEAAEIGRTAVIFGTHIEFKHLSNIVLAHSLRDLPKILKDSVKDIGDSKRKKIIWETQILKQSYIDLGFYAHDTPATQGKNLFIAKDQMEKAVKLLVILCDLQKANYLKSKGI